MLTKIAILFLVTLSACLGFFLRSSDAFSIHDIFFFTLTAFGVLLIEVFVIWAAGRLVRKPGAVSLACAAAIIFNVYCLRAVLIDDFAVLPMALHVVAVVGGTFVVYTLLSIIDDGHLRPWSALATVGLLSLLDLAPGLIAWQQLSYDELPSTAAGSTTASPNIQLVEFKRKPHVFIVSFDALMPRSLARKHLSHSGFAYQDLLEAKFRTFPNMFADEVPTRRSLNALLALDPDYFYSLKKHWTLFQGYTPSPLFQIFKSNGYTTNTVFRSNYFGHIKGPHVDNYYFSKRALTLCEFIDESTSVLTLFGYCRFVTSRAGKYLQKRLSVAKPEQLSFLLDKYERAQKSGSPSIFVSYIYSPGHTGLNYRHTNKEMRENYPKKHAKKGIETANMIRKLVDYVDRQDGNAVLVITGDHGPWISRGISEKDDATFYIQDRYGIYGGIYPSNLCPSIMDQAQSGGFTTINTILRRLVQCLSGGQDPFVKDVDYRIREFTNKGLADRYEEYVYE